MSLSSTSWKVLFLLAVAGVCILTGLNMKAKKNLGEFYNEVTSLRAYKENALVEKAAIGLRLPESLLTELRRTSSSDSQEPQFRIIYFVSASSCRPCVQEDIESSRTLVMRKGKCLGIFFAGAGLSNREFLAMKSFFDIDFPVIPLSFDPKAIGIDRYPTTILTNRQGVILFQTTTLVQDTLATSISRLALHQLAENLTCE